MLGFEDAKLKTLKAEYTAEEDKVTTINSDTFGFMAHQNSNRIIIEKGTEVNTGNATFLVKSGSSNETLEASVDDAVITNGGVLIQVMDNDDASLGHFGKRNLSWEQ